MKQISKKLIGFTLVEVLIVVGIVTVLGAIAYPAYRDYVVRGQTSEAFNLFNEAKLLSINYLEFNDEFPKDNEDLKLETSGNFVSSMFVRGTNDTLSIKTFFSSTNGFQANSVINNGYIEFIGKKSSLDTIIWSCLPDGKIVKKQFVPSVCDGNIFSETPIDNTPVPQTKPDEEKPTNPKPVDPIPPTAGRPGQPETPPITPTPDKDKDIINEDGSITHPDGTITFPDGSIGKPDGSILHPDGSMTQPDGSTLYPDGKIVYPDGSIKYPNGVIKDNAGNTYYPDGTIEYSNGSVKNRDGSTTTSEGKIILTSQQKSKYPGISSAIDSYNNAFDRYNRDKVGIKTNEDTLRVYQPIFDDYNAKINSISDQNERNKIINSSEYNNVKNKINQANSNLNQFRNDLQNAIIEIKNNIINYNNRVEDYKRNVSAILPEDFPIAVKLPN